MKEYFVQKGELLSQKYHKQGGVLSVEYFEEASLNEKDGDWKGDFSGKMPPRGRNYDIIRMGR